MRSNSRCCQLASSWNSKKPLNLATFSTGRLFFHLSATKSFPQYRTTQPPTRFHQESSHWKKPCPASCQFFPLTNGSRIHLQLLAITDYLSLEYFTSGRRQKNGLHSVLSPTDTFHDLHEICPSHSCSIYSASHRTSNSLFQRPASFAIGRLPHSAQGKKDSA